MKLVTQIRTARLRRQSRVRVRVRGTAARPRLSVFRSNAFTYAQLIDDVAGKTLAQASSREVKEKGTKTNLCVAVGTLLAERALKQKITTAVMDRGPYKYHGRVKALADAARKAGLTF
jgi:large subunit ribosomal protein L18